MDLHKAKRELQEAIAKAERILGETDAGKVIPIELTQDELSLLMWVVQDTQMSTPLFMSHFAQVLSAKGRTLWGRISRKLQEARKEA